jgi:hypothetical protein
MKGVPGSSPGVGFSGFAGVNCEVWDDSDDVIVVYDCTIMFINGASARRRVLLEGDDWRLL